MSYSYKLRNKKIKKMKKLTNLSWWKVVPVILLVIIVNKSVVYVLGSGNH